MTSALHAYEADIGPARQRVRERPELRELMAVDADPGRLHAFLIQWASLSILLQEPAEHYLVECSRRCGAEPKLSLTLLHVANEAIHFYRLLADDTRSLAQQWNDRRLPRLDLTSLLTQPKTPAIHRCHALHEQIVLGPTPWTELAFVFEINAMLASIAGRVLDQATRLLGEAIRPGLRSVEGLARQAANSSLSATMAGFLESNPERREPMVETGARALELYTEFLLECCVAASNLATGPATGLVRQHAS